MQGRPDPEVPGYLSAIVNDDSFNSWRADARRDGGYIKVHGYTFDLHDRQVDIRLTLRATVGAEQQIGEESTIAATVSIWYGRSEGWIADGTVGSGTMTLTTLTPEGATGTFEFTAHAVDPSYVPAMYRVVRGTFNIPFDQ